MSVPAAANIPSRLTRLHQLPFAAMLVVASWAMLLAAVLAAPWWLHPDGPGDDLIRHTIRLALVYWGAALALIMFLQRDDWRRQLSRGRLARWCWTLAWLTYLVHLAMAFHFYHHWSHDHAISHTERVSGFGPGIYLSHVFTLVWSLDVFTWWLWPERYFARSSWIDRLLHGFMVFIVFNATVVYESGLIRWAGLAGLSVLAILGLIRLRQRRAIFRLSASESQA
jgi:hypothetical protein